MLPAAQVCLHLALLLPEQKPIKLCRIPKRDLRRFLGALATFHVSHAVTLWEWCRLNACALLLLLAWCRAGNRLPFIPSWEPPRSGCCRAQRSLQQPPCCPVTVLCFPHRLEFCLSISKLNKEGNNIIGQNIPKSVFQFLQ